MTDRELLALAAKAAGKPIRWDGDVAVLLEPEWKSDKCSAWNPLTDDGDALRLAVKLRIDIEWMAEDTVFADNIHQLTEWHNGDAYSATRRAIVRAAAELGR